MSGVMFDPRLSKRLQKIYKLERPPTTLIEFVELGRALIQATNPEELGVPLLLHDAADFLMKLHTI